MASTISLSNPARDLDPALLDAPGGFAWWYVDHIDEQGDGLVLIWSYGLPFLPGYLGASRDGRPELPRSRPSLNLVLYEAGRPSFYLLQEYAPHEAAWSPDTWHFGRSRITLTRDPGRVRLVAELDCPVPRSQDGLTGRIELVGPAARFEAAPAGRPEHEWCPVAGPSTLRADLEIGGARVERAGLAYHDRNGGTAPLDRLGIHRWTWGRFLTPDALDIYYVLWPEGADAAPEAWGVTVDAAGQATLRTGLEIEARGEARATYGVRHAPELALRHGDEVWLSTTTRRVVDDGPFYLRTVVERDGAGVAGVGEWVVPERIDRPWQRPFVRMRVHHTAKDNSAWLPLFSGPRRGRLSRLVGRATP